MTNTLRERFWSKVDRAGPAHPQLGTACWTWVGSKSEKGYGRLSAGKHRASPLRAHRVSWELHKGPIPDKMFVLHNCDNPTCVNPDHLFIGTARDNTRDMVRKGRLRSPFIRVAA